MPRKRQKHAKPSVGFMMIPAPRWRPSKHSQLRPDLMGPGIRLPRILGGAHRYTPGFYKTPRDSWLLGPQLTDCRQTSRNVFCIPMSVCAHKFLSKSAADSPTDFLFFTTPRRQKHRSDPNKVAAHTLIGVQDTFLLVWWQYVSCGPSNQRSCAVL